MSLYTNYFNDIHEQARLTARQFNEREVLPFINDWEEAGSFPREIYKKAGDAGLLGVGHDAAYGGTGEDVFLKVAVTEELMRCGSGGFAASLGSLDIALPPLEKWGSQELKDKFIPPVLAGDMIAALDTVRVALERRRPRPGRLRGIILGGGAAVVAALAVFWVPNNLTSHTAAVLPEATEAALGRLALADLERLTGSACATPLGVAAAQTLMARLFPENPPRLVILREGLTAPAHLSGHMILLPAAALDQTDGPDVVAGYVLAEQLRAQADSATAKLLSYAGLIATVRLLASGSLSATAVEGYAETFLAQAPLPVSNDDLIAAFKAADVSASPYAFALDPTGQSVVALIEKDPFLGGSPRPVLDDGAWVSLQGICTD